jgi:RHS repeat-associated protein
MTDRYVYTPYGVEAPLNTSGNPFRYTGRRYDPESELYYYRARYYWPEIGRFLETDRNRPVNPPLSLPTTSPDFRA